MPADNDAGDTICAVSENACDAARQDALGVQLGRQPQAAAPSVAPSHASSAKLRSLPGGTTNANVDAGEASAGGSDVGQVSADRDGGSPGGNGTSEVEVSADEIGDSGGGNGSGGGGSQHTGTDGSDAAPSSSTASAAARDAAGEEESAVVAGDPAMRLAPQHAVASR